MIAWLTVLLLVTGGEDESPSAVERMRAEAQGLRDLVTSAAGRAFLDAAAELPSIAPRTLHREQTSRAWFSTRQMEVARDADDTLVFESLVADESRYYDTKYGTPMAYARLVDLLGDEAGYESFEGRKLLDIGYGTIGHLRLLATGGAHVVGLDVDSFLTALYDEPGDTGAIAGSAGADGSITLLSGRFSEPDIVAGIGGDYDVIFSKNTLKRGYVNPPADAKVDPRMLIDLGVDDETFLRALFAALRPGGHLAIYNISGKQNDWRAGEPYLPMADGHCPYDVELLRAVGFEPLVLDDDDTPFVREMARIFGWDQGPGAMDLEDGLFARFTLLVKPAS